MYRSEALTDISFITKNELEDFLSSFRSNLFARKRFSFLVFVISLFCSIYIWQSFIKIQRHHLKKIVYMDLKLAEAKLNSFVEARKNRLKLLADKLPRVETVNLTNQPQIMGFDFIAFVDNQYRIEQVNKDSSSLVGKTIALEESDRLYLEAFKESRKIAISSKLNIHNKGKEIDFFVPIVDDSGQFMKGLLLGSVKLENLFAYLFSDLHDRVNIKVFATDQEIYSNSEEVLSPEIGSFFWSYNYNSVYNEIYIALSGQESVRVVAWPAKKLIDSFSIIPHEYILFIGFLFSILFAVSFYFISSTRIVFSNFESLIEKLDKKFQENQFLRDNLNFVAKNAKEDLNSKSQALKQYKENTYRLMQEVLESKYKVEQKTKVILKDSNRLKLALESVGIGTWAWDIKKDRIIWDDFTRKIFGVSDNKNVTNYNRFLERVSAKDFNRVVSKIEELLNNGGNLNISFRINCPGNYEKEITLKSKVFLGPDSEPLHMAGIVLDNSYDLNNSMLLNRFFSLPIVMFCVADLRGNFKILNSAWSDVLGYSISELKSKPFIYFVHPKDKDKTQIEYQLLMGEEGYQTINFSNRYRCKDGSYKILVWNAIKMKHENQIYAIAWDMTGTYNNSDLTGLDHHRAAF